MTTQCEQVLKHLRTRGSLTPLDALNEYGIFRLAARCLELRERGHDVINIKQSEGEKTFGRYVLRT